MHKSIGRGSVWVSGPEIGANFEDYPNQYSGGNSTYIKVNFYSKQRI